jgi:hypothetical protein
MGQRLAPLGQSQTVDNVRSLSRILRDSSAQVAALVESLATFRMLFRGEGRQRSWHRRYRKVETSVRVYVS